MIKRQASTIAGAVLLISMFGASGASRPSPAPVAPAKGTRFDSVGHVSLHAGQPCTSQIMFDFHGRTLIWLAAPKHETAILTEAVQHHQRVRVAGLWRRGSQPGCAFVEVTSAVPEKKILGIF